MNFLETDVEYRCCFGCGSEMALSAPWSSLEFAEAARLARPGYRLPCRSQCERTLRLFFRRGAQTEITALAIFGGEEHALATPIDATRDLSFLNPEDRPSVLAIFEHLRERRLGLRGPD